MTKMPLPKDNQLNPALREQVQGLRGAMLKAARTQAVPKRFVTKPSKTRPALTVTDTATGRTAEVGLHAAGAAALLLAALFPEQPLADKVYEAARALRQALDEATDAGISFQGQGAAFELGLRLLNAKDQSDLAR